MAEILYKIGASANSGDGDVIAVKPDGFVLTWEQCQSWMVNGNPPADVLFTWPEYLRIRFNRRFLKMQYLLTHTVAECVEHFGSKPKNIEEEKRIATIEIAKMQEFGIDTSWGWEDLKKHGVICCDDMTDHDREKILEPDRTDDEKATYIGKRKYKIDYESLLDESKKADLKDKGKYVAVDRSKKYKIKDIAKKKEK